MERIPSSGASGVFKVCIGLRGARLINEDVFEAMTEAFTAAEQSAPELTVKVGYENSRSSRITDGRIEKCAGLRPGSMKRPLQDERRSGTVSSLADASAAK